MPKLLALLRPAAFLAAVPLAGCVTPPPSGPTVVALPGAGVSLTQFQADDLACRNYAQLHTAPPGATQAAANRTVAGSAVAGTALGAAAGALLGAAGGNAGAGAAIGAGAGLLTGTAVGASNANAVAGGAQMQYDTGYAQCMASKGNTIENPDLAAANGPVAYYSYPYYGAYPYGGVVGVAPFYWGPHWNGGWHGGPPFHGGFGPGGWHGAGWHGGPPFHGGFGPGGRPAFHGGVGPGGGGHFGGGNFGH